MEEVKSNFAKDIETLAEEEAEATAKRRNLELTTKFLEGSLTFSEYNGLGKELQAAYKGKHPRPKNKSDILAAKKKKKSRAVRRKLEKAGRKAARQ